MRAADARKLAEKSEYNKWREAWTLNRSIEEREEYVRISERIREEAIKGEMGVTLESKYAYEMANTLISDGFQVVISGKSTTLDIRW